MIEMATAARREPAMLSRADLRDRLARPAPPGIAGDDVSLPHDRPLTLAAVLIPFVLGPAPGILLTRRGERLTAHAGQVSFPGGRIEPDDASAEAAALREAQEETGLDPAQVELIGRLPDYVTGSAFRVTPVLGLLPQGLSLDALGLRPSPDEVDALFQLPLAVLMDPDAPRRQKTVLRGREREFWVWPHPEHYIWGATAAILVNLAARLRLEGPCSG